MADVAGDDVFAMARRWLADDPDPETREELQRLLDIGDEPGLRDRFSATLAFGTAGIRGTLGAGPARMNRALVRRVTAGLAERLGRDGALGGVVVGHDARHKSADFAEDTARVLAGAGIPVERLQGPNPTPLLAFAVRHLDAAAGVQVTASHNPPSDNGYKVYGQGGRLLLPPVDGEIAAAIEGITSLSSVPLAVGDDPLLGRVGWDVTAAYLDAVTDLAMDRDATADLHIVYTPLHGVGGELCTEALRRVGAGFVEVVQEQAEPDPDFPTVEFPNPEEPGALDLALALAQAGGADLLIANDPDADRIAVAVPTPAGSWRMLTGDEVGCLLAADRIANASDVDPWPAVATTVVSSGLLRRIAERWGAVYRETLTGFKWLAAEAATIDEEGGRMVLAYEQALGVSVGDVVRDKDGIGAAVAVADLAGRLKVRGRTLMNMLDDLAQDFGVHRTGGRSVRLEGTDDAELIGRALARLSEPIMAIGGIKVAAVADHRAGVQTGADGSVEPIALPETDLLRFYLEDGSRLMVRPSGTEPLLKFYGEVVAPVDERGVPAARDEARGRLARLLDEFTALALG